MITKPGIPKMSKN